MKSRLLVAAFGIPLVAAVLIAPPIAVTIFISAISVMSVFELFCAVGAKKSSGGIAVCALSAIIIQLAAYFKAGVFFYACLSMAFIIILFALWVAYHEREREFRFAHFSAAVLSGLMIPLCLSSLVMLRNGENGLIRIIIPVGTAFIGDAGALFAGMAFGKHKLAPKTSPKKTVEGMIGGIAASVIFMMVYGLIIVNVCDVTADYIKLAAIGAAAGILAQLGDLAFSLIKREFEIKDYGSFLPGHGGALDRFDSMVTVAPAVLLMLMILRPF